MSDQSADGARTYHHGALREALVDAAEDVLAERGVDAFTLRECARRAGVSHAAPAYHFGDVQGLLTEVAARGFERLSDLMAQRVAGAGEESKRRLRALGEAYVEFAVAHRALFQLMFRGDRLDRGQERLRTAGGAALDLLRSTLGEVGGRDQGGSRLGTRAGVVLAWSAVHGFSTLLLEGQLGKLAEDEAPEEIGRVLGREMLELLAE